MQTVEEILTALDACVEYLSGEPRDDGTLPVVALLIEARRSLSVWVAKDRIAGQREEWRTARQHETSAATAARHKNCQTLV